MRARSLARLTTVLLTSITAVVAYAVPADADGGPSIAGAPAATPGAQNFGNTTNGSSIGCYKSQYWALSVVSGDQVVIDWESAMWPVMWVYPVGTTDFNVEETDALEYFDLSSNHKAQSTFTAPTSGVMPIRFRTYSCDDRNHGPYDFLPSINHAVVVGVQRPATLAMQGSLTVSAATPDGVPITSGIAFTVQARIGDGDWVSAGSAPSTGASTSVPYSLPSWFAGRSVEVQVTAAGTGYLTATSRAMSLETPAGPPSTGGGGGGKGHHKKVTLHAASKTVPHLGKVHLSGRTSAGRGARVTIYQKLVTKSSWVVEGHVRAKRGGRFHYSEVVHSLSRTYQACVGRTCSRKVFVRTTG